MTFEQTPVPCLVESASACSSTATIWTLSASDVADESADLVTLDPPFCRLWQDLGRAGDDEEVGDPDPLKSQTATDGEAHQAPADDA